jgi:hypothetical protein
MMATEKDLELIQFLSKGTEDGQVQWQPTAEADQFVTSLRGKYGVRIGKVGNLFYLNMRDLDDRELLSVSSEESYFVEALFDSARRAALKVDEAIDDILHG